LRPVDTSRCARQTQPDDQLLLGARLNNGQTVCVIARLTGTTYSTLIFLDGDLGATFGGTPHLNAGSVPPSDGSTARLTIGGVVGIGHYRGRLVVAVLYPDRAVAIRLHFPSGRTVQIRPSTLDPPLAFALLGGRGQTLDASTTFIDSTGHPIP
jgi:hypothetical protein